MVNPFQEVLVSGRNAPGRLSWVSWRVAGAPWLMILGVASLALHVMLGLGHWPELRVERYQTAGASLHRVVGMGCVYFVAFAAAPLWFFTLFIRAARRLPPEPMMALLQLTLFFVGCLAAVGIYQWDPFGAARWLLD